MAIIPEEITLDISHPQQWVRIRVQQNDANEKDIYVNITDDGDEYNIPTSGVSVVLEMMKPDNIPIFNNCSIVNNKAKFTISEQMTVASGMGVAKIRITDVSTGGVIHTVPFYIYCDAEVINDSMIVSTGEFTALTEMILNMTQYQARFAQIGDLSLLSTESNTDLVGAINENYNRIRDVSLSLSDYPKLPWEPDDTDRFRRAIDACGGTHNLLTEYKYDPAKILEIPSGTFTISSRLFIDKNNIKIKGAGQFNTVIQCDENIRLSEMIRFCGAYACELSDLTLDGNLPFFPDGTETTGVDIGLVVDQVAHFESRNLNICNIRSENMRAIHLWESYFENLRLFSSGYFSDANYKATGIRFTDEGKEEDYFTGGESNEITFNKLSISNVSSYVTMNEVFVTNVYFNDVIAEGRPLSVAYPTVSNPKWLLGSSCSDIIVKNAYTHAHEQPFQSNSTLFEVETIGRGCKFLNYHCYNFNPTAGRYNEITTILHTSGATPIEINISVGDIIGSEGYLTDAINIDPGCSVYGKIFYDTDLTYKSVDTLFYLASRSRFNGDVIIKDGTEVKRYTSKTLGSDYSLSNNVLLEEFKCRAWANFNGTTGTLNAGGNIADITRIGVGAYWVTFSKSMPDNIYACPASSNKSSTKVITQTIDQMLINVFNDGVPADSDSISVTVFR